MTTKTVCLMLMLAISGCSSGTVDVQGDGGQRNSLGSGLPQGYGPLWPCDTPGAACNAHDGCAISTVCGEDLLCYPSKLQDCDDKLPCTEDRCMGMGLCEHRPLDGACALSVAGELRCFKADDRHPDRQCQVCDPEESPSSWTGANGGGCDDGDACTMDDYCQVGECKGTRTDDKCTDPLGQ